MAARPIVDPAAGADSRAWLPPKAQLSMRSRLFSKNIFYSGDIWARGTATWTSTFLFGAFIAAVLYVIHHWYSRLTAPNGSSRHDKPLWQLSTMLADDSAINSLDNELDSDEYEDEQDSPQSGGFLAGSRERHALRRLLGRGDHSSKRSSIVRITSSDPTSSLCEHPIHVDLEPTTRRSFWPAPHFNTPPSPASPASPTSPTPNSTPSGQRIVAGSGSPNLGSNRRRKESGRLLSADSGRRQHTASPSRSPLASNASLPVRPTRVRPVDSRSPLSRAGGRNKRNSTSSLSSVEAASESKAPSSANFENVVEDAWTDEAQAATLLSVDDGEQLPGTPSMASESSFASAGHGHTSAFAEEDALSSPSGCSSPTSSTFSISRAPSILKRRPQSFRTASLRDIDISYSLMQRKASLPSVSMLGPVADSAALHQHQQELYAYGGAGSPAPPPYQPSQPVSSSVADQPKVRSIKLVEPDWQPHLDSHIRARERFETATRFAAFKISNGKGGLLGSPDDSVDGDDFWFERFTQSTAAAGRDWDWRKRRARLQRAAALGMALGQSGLTSPNSPNLPGNVGKTDVQLQREHGAVPTSAAQAAAAPLTRKVIPAAPLITFTEQELQSAPNLKIDTETGRRMAAPRSSIDAPLSPTALNGTPLSPTPTGTGTPLGGIFGAAIPSADSVSAVMAARMAQRRRASEDATSNGGFALKGRLDKAMRRRQSASADTGSSHSNSPSTESLLGGSPLRESTQFASAGDVSRSSIDANPSSPNGVPSRLSSLGGTMGKKVSLTNIRAGFRRGSSANGNDFLQDANGSGIELVPNSPDFTANDNDDDEFFRGGTSSSAFSPTPEEGPRSSADAYSFTAAGGVPTSHGEEEGLLQSVPISRTDSLLRQQREDTDDSFGSSIVPSRTKASEKRPQFRGGSSFTKFSSAPAATSPPPSLDASYQQQNRIVEELKQDFDRDSAVSQGSSSSNSSDSLRRRLRSQTDSATTGSSGRYGSLSASPLSTPSIPSSSSGGGKVRARTGSRSSIMRSASGASNALDRNAKRRAAAGGETDSINSSLQSINEKKKAKGARMPSPQLQPEPAPRGMVQRARSASLSSNNSSVASGSRRGSFRDGAAAGLGLKMTPERGDEGGF